MPMLYVAKSQGLAKWGASVGLTKHLYLLGLADVSAEAAVKTLNESAIAGQTDWKLLKKRAVDGLDEGAAIDRLGAREKLVDPALYPGIKGARGIFKVKLVNVENSVLVAKAMAGQESLSVKITPADIGEYLLANAVA